MRELSEILDDIQSISSGDKNCLAAIERLVLGQDIRTEILLQILEEFDGTWLSNFETKAAWGLGELKDPVAVEPLISHLQNTNNTEMQGYIIEALGKIGDARALKPILECAYNSRDNAIDEIAIKALCSIGRVSPGEIWNLLEYRYFLDQGLILLAINRMVNLGPRACMPKEVNGVIEKILPSLRHSCSKVRLSALQICLKLDAEFSSEHLYHLLDDGDKTIRYEVSIALAKRSDPIGFRELIKNGFHVKNGQKKNRNIKNIPFKEYECAAIDGIKSVLEEIEEFVKLKNSGEYLDDDFENYCDYDHHEILGYVRLALKDIGSMEAMAILEGIAE